jgi:hypothetical protein
MCLQVKRCKSTGLLTYCGADIIAWLKITRDPN